GASGSGRRWVPYVIYGLPLLFVAVFVVLKTTGRPAGHPPKLNAQTAGTVFSAALGAADSADAQSISLTNNSGTEIISAAKQALDVAQNDRQREQAEYWIGDGYFWEQQNRLALLHERRAIQYYGSDPYAYVMQGNLELDLGQPKAALSSVNKAL